MWRFICFQYCFVSPSDSLLAYFSQYGEVIDCVVMKNQQTGKSRGFGFVTYRDVNCVETVLSVPSHIIDGRQVLGQTWVIWEKNFIKPALDFILFYHIKKKDLILL